MKVLAWLDRHGIHIHWRSRVEFPPPLWPMEFEPRRVCRCGDSVMLGTPERYFIDTNGEWDYDDAMYE